MLIANMAMLSALSSIEQIIYVKYVGLSPINKPISKEMVESIPIEQPEGEEDLLLISCGH